MGSSSSFTAGKGEAVPKKLSLVSEGAYIRETLAYMSSRIAYESLDILKREPPESLERRFNEILNLLGDFK
jgi:hypothetical protein